MGDRVPQRVGCERWTDVEHSGPPLRGCPPPPLQRCNHGHLLQGGTAFPTSLSPLFISSSLQDRTIAVWDMRAPHDIVLRRVLVGHRAAVNVVDFDDRYIVSASGDRTIKVCPVLLKPPLVFLSPFLSLPPLSSLSSSLPASLFLSLSLSPSLPLPSSLPPSLPLCMGI